MIVEAPMWLLVPVASVLWMLYFGVVLAERRERAEVDRQAKRREEERRAQQVSNDHAAINRGSHVGRVSL